MLNDTLSIEAASLIEVLSMFIDVLYEGAEPSVGLPILTVGERHGTEEVPALIGDLSRLIVSAHFSHAGMLKASSFWCHPVDGRASKASFALLNRLRELRVEGAEISVKLIDERVHYTEQELVDPVLQAIRRVSDECPVLLYMGNLHAATRSSWDPRKQAYFDGACKLMKEQLVRDVRSLNIEPKGGGDAWGRRDYEEGKPITGPYSISPSRREYLRNSIHSIPMMERPDCLDALDYVLLVERFTASPPLFGDSGFSRL